LREKSSSVTLLSTNKPLLCYSLHPLQRRIDIVETVATVRLELENWNGRRFTDMFTLLKVDGEWKIMNKVFHLHP